MSLVNTECSSVQENIAWGKGLGENEKLHILNCTRCSLVATQFEELDSLMKNEEIVIPNNFADQVMFKINQQEIKKSQSIYEFISLILDSSICRWGVAGIGFLAAFSAH
jgi:hypothetical protein